MQRVPKKVGVSPGTTTLVLGGTVECPNPGATAFQVATLGPPQNFDWLRTSPQWRQRWWGKTEPAASPAERRAATTPTTVSVTAKDKALVSTAEPSAARRVVAAFSPYGTFESMKGASVGSRLRQLLRRHTNLGIVLSPHGDISPLMYSEISATMQNIHYQCGPFDPQYTQNGEAGYYYDTPLGSAKSTWQRWKAKWFGAPGLGNVSPPSDLQLSRIYGYTPQMSSYVPFQNVTWTIAPWTPPNGGSGSMYPVIGPALRGARRQVSRWRSLFGDTPPADTATETFVETTVSPAQAALNELRRHQDRLFTLSVASTAAIVGGFLLSVIKDRREVRRNSRKATSETPAITPMISGARRRRYR
jgi:hypothetical protein